MLCVAFVLFVSFLFFFARAGIDSLEADVRDFDPKLALDGGADGLDAYRAITAAAPAVLKKTGRLVLELGIGQERPVRRLVGVAGLAVKKVVADLAGTARAMVVVHPAG